MIHIDNSLYTFFEAMMPESDLVLRGELAERDPASRKKSCGWYFGVIFDILTPVAFYT